MQNHPVKDALLTLEIFLYFLLRGHPMTHNGPWAAHIRKRLDESEERAR